MGIPRHPDLHPTSAEATNTSYINCAILQLCKFAMQHLLQLVFVTLLAMVTLCPGQRPFMRPQQPFQRKPQAPKVMCTADSLMIYQDCLLCVCPRPNRAAKCFRKSCDLRTKDSGQCPPTVMKLDDNKLCPGAPTHACRTDADCPDKAICCFDFCKGNQCVGPQPLDAGTTVHRGLGYA